jgi:hypothetical protein
MRKSVTTASEHNVDPDKGDRSGESRNGVSSAIRGGRLLVLAFFQRPNALHIFGSVPRRCRGPCRRAALRRAARPRSVAASFWPVLLGHAHGRAQGDDHRAEAPCLGGLGGLAIRSIGAAPQHEETGLLAEEIRDADVDQDLEQVGERLRKLGIVTGNVTAESPVLGSEAPHHHGSDSGAMSSDEWAWVELNYRPHAYQACALTT